MAETRPVHGVIAAAQRLLDQRKGGRVAITGLQLHAPFYKAMTYAAAKHRTYLQV